MYKTIATKYNIVLTIIIAIASYSSIAKQVASGEVVGGFRLTISTTNDTFLADRSVDLTVSLQNVSTNSTMISIGSRDVLFKIVGPDGSLVQTTAFGEKMLYPKVFLQHHGETLPPGGKFDRIISLNTCFEMKEAGEYSVTVSQNVSKGKSMSAGPLKILIVGPEKKTDDHNLK